LKEKLPGLVEWKQVLQILTNEKKTPLTKNIPKNLDGFKLKYHLPIGNCHIRVIKKKIAKILMSKILCVYIYVYVCRNPKQIFLINNRVIQKVTQLIKGQEQVVSHNRASNA
jgi:hypothetical protein